MERVDADFGACAAWHYKADGDGPRPCVVMAHGFSLTRHDGLPTIAETFANAGYDVLLFDHRHLGDSAGSDPQRFRIAEQAQDWRDAIAHARRLEGVDPDKLVLWGYSFSGGHVAGAAVADPRVKAVLMLCPFVDGFARVLVTRPGLTAWILPRASADRLGRHVRIPVTSPVGGHGAMSLPGEYDGFMAAVPPGSPWKNEIGPGLFLTVALFRPLAKAKRLTQPAWVGVGTRDVSVSEKAVRKFAANAPRAELTAYDYDHFEPLYGDGVTRVAADQLQFLQRTVS